MTSDKRETLRLFVALPLPDDLLAELAAVQERLRRAIQSRAVRWARPEQIHLTLQFLGNVPAERIPALQTALIAATEGKPPLRLALDAPGAFPNPRRPRVLWVGLRGDLTGLAALQTSVAAAGAPCLAEPDRGTFHPHLTLGRIKDRDRRLAGAVGDALAGCPPPRPLTWRASEIRLMRSLLQPDGAVHSTLARLPLGQAQPPAA